MDDSIMKTREPGTPRAGARAGLRAFSSDTRAGAAILLSAAAAFLGLLTGTLVVDHKWMVHERDLLKNAIANATIAATEAWAEGNHDRADLERIARHWILANLEHNLSDGDYRAIAGPDGLTVRLTLPGGSSDGNLRLTAEAVGLGDTLVSERFMGDVPGLDSKLVQSAEVAQQTSLTEVVLAIDSSVSMSWVLSEQRQPDPDDPDDLSRMALVRAAARSMVDILMPEGSTDSNTAIAVLPWHYTVRLPKDLRKTWEDHRWVRYPTEITYHKPLFTASISSGSTCYAPRGKSVVQTTPTKRPSEWEGCIARRTTNALDATVDPPSVQPFEMQYFPPWRGRTLYCKSDLTIPPGSATSSSEQCYVGPAATLPAGTIQSYCDIRHEAGERWCLSFDYLPTVDQPNCDRSYSSCLKVTPRSCSVVMPPAMTQGECAYPVTYNPDAPVDGRGEFASILPLSTDRATVLAAVDALMSSGKRTSATDSTLGLTWGRRLLNAQWRDAWGGEVHPVEPADDEDDVPVNKVIVLLTDGQNYVDRTPGIRSRQAGTKYWCDLAKKEGILIYTVSANDPSSAETADLRQCSSETTDSDVQYSFNEDVTEESLQEAFREIARQLVSLRRVS